MLVNHGAARPQGHAQVQRPPSGSWQPSCRSSCVTSRITSTQLAVQPQEWGQRLKVLPITLTVVDTAHAITISALEFPQRAGISMHCVQCNDTDHVSRACLNDSIIVPRFHRHAIGVDEYDNTQHASSCARQARATKARHRSRGDDQCN